MSRLIRKWAVGMQRIKETHSILEGVRIVDEVGFHGVLE